MKLSVIVAPINITEVLIIYLYFLPRDIENTARPLVIKYTAYVNATNYVKRSLYITR